MEKPHCNSGHLPEGPGLLYLPLSLLCFQFFNNELVFQQTQLMLGEIQVLPAIGFKLGII